MSVSINDLKDLVSDSKTVSIRKEWVKSVNNDGTLSLDVPAGMEIPSMGNDSDASLRAENETLKNTISELQAKAEAETSAHAENLSKLEEKFSNKFSELEKKMDPPIAKASENTKPTASFAKEVESLGAYDDNMLPAHAIFYWGARNRDRDNTEFSENAFNRVVAQEREETRRLQEWFA